MLPYEEQEEGIYYISNANRKVGSITKQPTKQLPPLRVGGRGNKLT